MQGFIDGSTIRIQSASFVSHNAIITPALATKWLATQINNRPIQDHSMRSYRADMVAGRWHFAGAPISFDTGGHLIDGQNRLEALSGVEVPKFALPFVVHVGLPPEAQMVMDQGARRTAGQQLGLKGIPNGRALAAGARLELSWQRGYLPSRWSTNEPISNTEVVQWIEDRPELAEYAAALRARIERSKLRSSAGIGFAMHLGLELADEVNEFYTQLDTLFNLPPGSPIMALSKRLNRGRGTRGDGVEEKMTEVDQLGMVIITWNHWVNGNAITKIQKPKGGWEPEHFTKIVGL